MDAFIAAATAAELNEAAANADDDWWWGGVPNESMMGRRRQRGVAPVPYVPRGNARRMTVTATIPGGVIFGDPVSPAPLDGILAWVGRRVRRGVRPMQRDRHIEGVPLSTINGRDVRGNGARTWIWLASCASFDTRAEEPFWRAGAVDEQFDDATVEGTRRINTAGGPDGSFWRPDTLAVTEQIAWRAVGDPNLVARWLTYVSAIGVGGPHGHGHVTEWNVEDAGDPGAAIDDLRWVLELGRPVPASWGEHLGLSGRRMGAYRPPYIDAHRTGIGRNHNVEVACP